jgi:adenylate cyclase class IV
MSEFQELEYKFKADNVKLQDFVALMESLQPTEKLDISSWDHYYTNNNEDFVRFRESDTPELTKKVKVSSNNNWDRIEVDIPLDPSRVKESTVAKFLELEGYKPNFKIYKNCFIYWLDKVNFVYYIVFDPNMKELGRFIEVEITKNELGGTVEVLKDAASVLEALGLNLQNRLKKSLFEMFKK